MAPLVYCQVCQKSCRHVADFKEHLRSREHRLKKAELFQKEEYWGQAYVNYIDTRPQSREDSLLGLSLVTVCLGSEKGGLFYLCHACEEKVSNIREHLNSSAHCGNYYSHTNPNVLTFSWFPDKDEDIVDPVALRRAEKEQHRASGMLQVLDLPPDVFDTVKGASYDKAMDALSRHGDLQKQITATGPKRMTIQTYLQGPPKKEHPLLGLDHLVECSRDGQTDRRLYLCMTCKMRRITAAEIIKHLLSFDHIRCYINAWHPRSVKEYDPSIHYGRTFLDLQEDFIKQMKEIHRAPITDMITEMKRVVLEPDVFSTVEGSSYEEALALLEDWRKVRKESSLITSITPGEKLEVRTTRASHRDPVSRRERVVSTEKEATAHRSDTDTRETKKVRGVLKTSSASHHEPESRKEPVVSTEKEATTRRSDTETRETKKRRVSFNEDSLIKLRNGPAAQRNAAVVEKEHPAALGPSQSQAPPVARRPGQPQRPPFTRRPGQPQRPTVPRRYWQSQSSYHRPASSTATRGFSGLLVDGKVPWEAARCYKCGELGHKRYNCPDQGGDRESPGATSTAEPRAAAMTAQHSTNTEPPTTVSKLEEANHPVMICTLRCQACSKTFEATGQYVTHVKGREHKQKMQKIFHTEADELESEQVQYDNILNELQYIKSNRAEPVIGLLHIVTCVTARATINAFCVCRVCEKSFPASMFKGHLSGPTHIKHTLMHQNPARLPFAWNGYTSKELLTSMAWEEERAQGHDHMVLKIIDLPSKIHSMLSGSYCRHICKVLDNHFRHPCFDWTCEVPKIATLDKLLDRLNYPLLGLQFMVRYTTDRGWRSLCLLCEKMLNELGFSAHVFSSDHVTGFLDKAHPGSLDSEAKKNPDVLLDLAKQAAEIHYTGCIQKVRLSAPISPYNYENAVIAMQRIKEMEGQGPLIPVLPAGEKLVPTEYLEETDSDFGSDSSPEMTRMPERDADDEHPDGMYRTPQPPGVEAIPVKKQAASEKDSRVHKPDEKKRPTQNNSVERRADAGTSVDRDTLKQRTVEQRTEKGNATQKADEGEEVGTERGATSKDATSRVGRDGNAETTCRPPAKRRRSEHAGPEAGVKRQRLSDAETPNNSGTTPTIEIASKTSKTTRRTANNRQVIETSVTVTVTATKAHSVVGQTTGDASKTGRHDTTQKRDSQLLPSPTTVLSPTSTCGRSPGETTSRSKSYGPKVGVISSTCGSSPGETPDSTWRSESETHGPAVGLNFLVAVMTHNEKRIALFCQLCKTKPTTYLHRFSTQHRLNYVRLMRPEVTSSDLSEAELQKIVTELAKKETGGRTQNIPMNSEREYEELTKAELPEVLIKIKAILRQQRGSQDLPSAPDPQPESLKHQDMSTGLHQPSHHPDGNEANPSPPATGSESSPMHTSPTDCDVQRGSSQDSGVSSAEARGMAAAYPCHTQLTPLSQDPVGMQPRIPRDPRTRPGARRDSRTRSWDPQSHLTSSAYAQPQGPQSCDVPLETSQDNKTTPVETSESTILSKYTIHGPAVGSNFLVAITHKERRAFFCLLCKYRTPSKEHVFRPGHRFNYVRSRRPELTAPLSDAELLRIATELAETDPGSEMQNVEMNSESEYEDLTRRSTDIPKALNRIKAILRQQRGSQDSPSAPNPQPESLKHQDMSTGLHQPSHHPDGNETNQSPPATGSQSSPTDTQPEGPQSCDVPPEASQDPRTQQTASHDSRSKPRPPRDNRKQSMASHDSRIQPQNPQGHMTSPTDAQAESSQSLAVHLESSQEPKTKPQIPQDTGTQPGARRDSRTRSWDPQSHMMTSPTDAHPKGPQSCDVLLVSSQDPETRQRAPQDTRTQPTSPQGSRTKPEACSDSRTQTRAPYDSGTKPRAPRDYKTQPGVRRDSRTKTRAHQDLRPQSGSPRSHITPPTDTQPEGPQSCDVQLASSQDPETRQRAPQDSETTKPWSPHRSRKESRSPHRPRTESPSPQDPKTQSCSPQDAGTRQKAPQDPGSRQEAPQEPATWQQVPQDCDTQPMAPQCSGTSQTTPQDPGFQPQDPELREGRRIKLEETQKPLVCPDRRPFLDPDSGHDQQQQPFFHPLLPSNSSGKMSCLSSCLKAMSEVKREQVVGLRSVLECQCEEISMGERLNPFYLCGSCKKTVQLNDICRHVTSIDHQYNFMPMVPDAMAFWNQEDLTDKQKMGHFEVAVNKRAKWEQFCQVDAQVIRLDKNSYHRVKEAPFSEGIHILEDIWRQQTSSCPPADQQPPDQLRSQDPPHTEESSRPKEADKSRDKVKRGFDDVSSNGDAEIVKWRRIATSPDASGTCDSTSVPCSNVSSTASQCPSPRHQEVRVKVEPSQCPSPQHQEVRVKVEPTTVPTTLPHCELSQRQCESESEQNLKCPPTDLVVDASTQTSITTWSVDSSVLKREPQPDLQSTQYGMEQSLLSLELTSAAALTLSPAINKDLPSSQVRFSQLKSLVQAKRQELGLLAPSPANPEYAAEIGLIAPSTSTQTPVGCMKPIKPENNEIMNYQNHCRAANPAGEDSKPQLDYNLNVSSVEPSATPPLPVIVPNSVKSLASMYDPTAAGSFTMVSPDPTSQQFHDWDHRINQPTSSAVSPSYSPTAAVYGTPAYPYGQATHQNPYDDPYYDPYNDPDPDDLYFMNGRLYRIEPAVFNQAPEQHPSVSSQCVNYSDGSTGGSSRLPSRM